MIRLKACNFCGANEQRQAQRGRRFVTSALTTLFDMRLHLSHSSGCSSVSKPTLYVVEFLRLSLMPGSWLLLLSRDLYVPDGVHENAEGMVSSMFELECNLPIFSGKHKHRDVHWRHS